MQEQFLSVILASASPMDRIGLAVSGGGDSMAMLIMAYEAGLDVAAVTVDHGLRPESAAEAEGVAKQCAQLGIRHSTLRWKWDGRGNFHDAARVGRREIMAHWGEENGIRHIALGHNRDDIAETFLMRLSRAAGLDGLAAMQDRWVEHGIEWCRPLLHVSRHRLRAYLLDHRIDWVDDPSNDDPKYERARARQALLQLPLGIDASLLAEVAEHLGSAKHELHHLMLEKVRSHCKIAGGMITILPGLRPEMLRRILIHSLKWLTDAQYAPRSDALARAMEAIGRSKRTTIQGCILDPSIKGLRIYREYDQVRNLRTATTEAWDGWEMAGDHDPRMHVGALGRGIHECKNRKDLGQPADYLKTTPAIWLDDHLIAAPELGFEECWRSSRPTTGFFGN